ncbi:MAG: methyltransferase domain-containing protein [Candidatus Magasanikbacteria bacterium]|nr:methyltransferase domain-containing protein [Candidatus Magasanikbacteria bacterium]
MQKGMKSITHENKVERFYSHGSKIRALEAGGYLSFGYWDKDTKEYFDAAENLVNFFLEEAKIENPENVLDVACGYSAESFRFFDAIKPKEMRCIDITQAHIDFAKKRAEQKHLEDKLKFEKKDACQTGYQNEFFSHIVGIEGPAHFNTRADFFKECYRVLKHKGKLMLTDITFDPVAAGKNYLVKKMTELGSQHWHMPKANWVNVDKYCEQLHQAGFKVEKCLRIGDKVFPAFARYNTRMKSMLRAVRTRGLPLGVGLSFISWLLGYGYRHGVIDYIFIKAEKN